LIEAVNLVPDFLEDLVSNNLLDALSGGVVRVEPLCQIALERGIPDVTDILTTPLVAGLRRSQRALDRAGFPNDQGAP